MVFLRLKESYENTHLPRWFDMSEIEKDFAVHEAVCAERYKEITERLDSGSSRMKRIEMGLWVIVAAVLLGPGVAAEFVKKLLGI